MFLGTFGLQAKLVQTTRRPKRNVFGHLRAFSPIWSKAGATHPPTHPGATHRPRRHPPTHQPGRHPSTHPPGRHPPTHPPTHPPGRHPSTRVPPIQPGASRPPTHPGATHQTAKMPKTNVFGHILAATQFGVNSRNANTNVFGHIRASGQCGPDREPPTHPPPGRHPSTRAPPNHPPTHPPAQKYISCKKNFAANASAQVCSTRQYDFFVFVFVLFAAKKNHTTYNTHTSMSSPNAHRLTANPLVLNSTTQKRNKKRNRLLQTHPDC